MMAAANGILKRRWKKGVQGRSVLQVEHLFRILSPLRERKEDIPLLVGHFAERYSEEHGRKIRGISTPTLDMLMGYHWPENVGGLESRVERAVIGVTFLLPFKAPYLQERVLSWDELCFYLFYKDKPKTGQGGRHGKGQGLCP